MNIGDKTDGWIYIGEACCPSYGSYDLFVDEKQKAWGFCLANTSRHPRVSTIRSIVNHVPFKDMMGATKLADWFWEKAEPLLIEYLKNSKDPSISPNSR